MTRIAAIVCLSALVSACAKVSVIPLEANGTGLKMAQEGVRYYLPKPYLLVAQIPLEPADKSKGQAAATADNGAAGGGGRAVTGRSKKGAGGTGGTQGGGAGGTSDGSSGSAKNAGGSGGTSSTSTDTSFAMFSKQYGIKLIYLPDYEHPMAISESPGLFGSSEMKPSLQDGWMLTALDATGDSKTAETISAVASLVGAAMTGGASSAAGGAKAAGGAAAGGGAPAGPSAVLAYTKTTAPPVLPPGLYKFVFDDHGRLLGLDSVVYFCSSGLQTGGCPPEASR